MADAETVPGFDPTSVDLTAADPRDIICYLNAEGNEYDGRLGARISAIFVLLLTSTAATVFPVLAARVRRLKIPLCVYLFARYFGAGVIIATAFIHLLDPAYEAVGPASCVGMTGHWADFSWVPAIALTAVMFTFLLDFGAEWYVENQYRLPHAHSDVEGAITSGAGADAHTLNGQNDHSGHHQHLHSADQEERPARPALNRDKLDDLENFPTSASSTAERTFREQIVAFIILEFGVIFHSVMIGLNLGVAGDEFSTLYPVIVFHQAFEGLGIGARLSSIPFPQRLTSLPWMLCAAYGLTTPVALAIGIGLSTQYNPGSFTATVVSGVLDSISAGILLYTGLVELLARDFLFNQTRTREGKRIAFMLVCLFLGIIIMALLGKWA